MILPAKGADEIRGAENQMLLCGNEVAGIQGYTLRQDTAKGDKLSETRMSFQRRGGETKRRALTCWKSNSRGNRRSYTILELAPANLRAIHKLQPGKILR